MKRSPPNIRRVRIEEERGRVWVADLLFDLEPLVLHRRLAHGVAGEPQVVARQESHRLRLEEDLQGWNTGGNIQFDSGDPNTEPEACFPPPDGLRHSRASELPRVCRWSIR